MPFDAPNYTQVPNDLFELHLSELSGAETKVIMAVCRFTFGYQRLSWDCSISKMEAITGLSNRAILDAAASLEARGLICRITDGHSSATWEVATTENVKAGGGMKKVHRPMKKVHRGYEESSQQVRLNKVKQSSKQILEEGEIPEQTNVFAQYEQEFGPLSPMLAEQLKELEKTYPDNWITAAFKIAVAQNARKLSYVTAILKRWQVDGFMSEHKQQRQPARNNGGGKSLARQFLDMIDPNEPEEEVISGD